MGDRLSEWSGNTDESFLISTRVQICGVLMKKPFGHQSNKWSKRFFIVKDGFLLYYPESEKKTFEKRGAFNLHPKGVIPLAGCSVEPEINSNNPYVINICSGEFSCGQISLAVDSRYEQRRWATALQEASRVTWKNAQYEETLIRELESQGLQLTKEKFNYIDKLQEETIALRDEINKNEELEKMATELEKEKEKLEKLIGQLEEEHEMVKRECEETTDALSTLEEDKRQLQQTTLMLQQTLTNLAKERERTLHLLQQKEEETQNLYVASEDFQHTLDAIEGRTALILAEKAELEQRYLEVQWYAQMMEEEKQIFSEQANQLLSSLNELMAQKELTESELKEEIKARLAAEDRLKDAEESLCHLEHALKEPNNTDNSFIANIMPDVQNLRKFFEKVEEESRLSADKPIIMKNAVVARKSYVQKSQLLKLEMARQEKVASLAKIFPENRGEPSLHRTQSLLVSNKAKKDIMKLRRTMSTRSPIGVSMQELQHSLPTMEE